MDISEEQLTPIVRGLLSQDQYKPLSPHLGGWFWATKAVWAIVGTFTSIGFDALEAMVLTALSVPGQFSDLLAQFVSDLFDALAIVADEASDIPADAEAFSQTPQGQALLGILAPEQVLMGKTGVDDRTLQTLATILNPLPVLVSFGAATSKNTADAGARIASSRRKSRT